MTLVVTWVRPANGDQIPSDQPNTFESYVAATLPSTSSGYRYRVLGTSTWTTIAASNGNTTIPAGTFAPNQQYEIERFLVQASDSGSASIVIDTAPVSVTPSVSAPTSPVAATPVTVTWATVPTTQQYAQVQVLDAGGVVVWDSGILAQTAQTLAGVPIPDTGVTRTVRVRIKRSRAFAWSLWGTTASLTVNHVAPPTPTITALTATDVAGIGLTHALVAAITHPVPSGQPAVVTTEVYVRRSGDSSNGQLVEVVTGAPTSYTYRSPTSGVSYQMRVRVIASDGRYAYSAWTTANAPLALRGVVLFSVAAPTAVRLFLYNGDEAEDDYVPESELIQYDGREFPVVEFGTSSSRVLSVEISVKTVTDRDNLRALVLGRALVCYRDRRGRKVYGVLGNEPIVDTIYGYTTTITVTAVDYPSDRSI